ncbi:MAG: sugar nucleotide-binding protein [Gammaproteobacteria bacterium]|nr:sugar nucleotide-binding protein [Gammaproteobacteria bacterium]MBV9696481.1 sugar nucleotide-binding protein [Gammaproteobacteria bacterium]
MRNLEVWGGIECTVNRVRNSWYDQLQRSGHERRLGDLDLVAGLGIRTLRYPVLWERCAPRSPAQIDWRWADQRLGRLRELRVRPIVGLVHHGSGPAYTDLTQPGFATGLAEFAARVAQRFPWVENYTPVNEPLTTARFSGLYGHWYPHGRETRIFVRALLNQCAATRLAMQAIRRVNSAARLVQTEDLGTTYSTERLRYQAEFDNERRWLTWDLLSGRVDRTHPLRAFLQAHGADPAELDLLVGEPCPADVIGINHYVTSDRYLDEALAAYPAATWGGNARERYADAEAVRVLAGPYRGWEVLEAAWARYHVPLALTEVHLGCTREEQVRWLHDAWQAAAAARTGGCQVLAIAPWALFGSYDWDSLLTRRTGHYEAGAFDCRAPAPRETALAGTIRSLCLGTRPEHPALGTRGWWNSSRKHLYRSAPAGASAKAAPAATRTAAARPVLICGAGSLGQALARACQERGLEHRVLSHAELDICNAAGVETILGQLRPWALINAAGYVKVDAAEHERAACYRANASGTRTLALASAQRRLRLLTFSSDLVFDGTATEPYLESSEVAPLGVYGRSKAAAEALLSSSNPDALCVRTAAFFGYWGGSDFLVRALQALAAGEEFVALADVTVSPTYLPDLVHAALDLLIDGERGLWHLANRGALTWAEFAARAAELAGVDASTLIALPQARVGLAAPRPRYSALGSERGQLLPDLEDALERVTSLAREEHLPQWRLQCAQRRADAAGIAAHLPRPGNALRPSA